MKKAFNKRLFTASIIIYIILIGLMIFTSIANNDLDLNFKLFNPENSVAKLVESFGQFVYWGMWGSAFAVIFLCRRDLNGCLDVMNKFFPFMKPIEDTSSGIYKFFNFVIKVVTTLGFFALCGIGWKKLIENVTKNILSSAGYDDLSQAVYFIISFAVAIISIFLFSKVNKKTLHKLEALALCGVLLGIFYKIVEELKPITSRVRFREMVAYSNGFLNEEGMSEGKYSPLTASMKNNTDFSAFTKWYKIGDDMGIYSRADSFPSGHTTYSCMLFMSSLFAAAFDKLKKYAPFLFCVSVLYSAFVAITRIIAGAHYLSDVTAALIIGYTLFLIVRAIYVKYSKAFEI